ncbi:hypothetical protein FNV43_RR00742 [Rhamnella rubrinervis]|uniref:Uncharacterized protein n=1 Tax=Rhamnella rubrinervis TaxID=2594499 RepID=A0A8K0MSB0_9ROSA|nr:hypothetical protein FNV43_RR00742 [Rhamnella rubrinervis]
MELANGFQALWHRDRHFAVHNTGIDRQTGLIDLRQMAGSALALDRHLRPSYGIGTAKWSAKLTALDRHLRSIILELDRQMALPPTWTHASCSKTASRLDLQKTKNQTMAQRRRRLQAAILATLTSVFMGETGAPKSFNTKFEACLVGIKSDSSRNLGLTGLPSSDFFSFWLGEMGNEFELSFAYTVKIDRDPTD